MSFISKQPLTIPPERNRFYHGTDSLFWILPSYCPPGSLGSISYVDTNPENGSAGLFMGTDTDEMVDA